MNRSTALLATLPLTLLPGVGVLVPTSAQAASTSVTATLSDSSVTLRTASTVSGTVTGPAGRTVRLQAHLLTGWRTLRTTTTSSSGTYRLSAPSSWLGAHTLRVLAPAVATQTAGASPNRSFTVRPAWSPAGATSDWKPLTTSRPRFNPCRAITWKFNRNGGYAASLDDLKGAFARLGQATGLTFSYEGTTGVAPKPGNYDRSVALTVGFTTATQVPSLGGAVAGQGGGSWMTHDGVAEMMRGTLTLDRAARLATGFTSSGGPTWGQIMEHEIGHALGLGHASGRSQLMNGTASVDNHRFGAGDLVGLRSVGLYAGCIPHALRTV